MSTGFFFAPVWKAFGGWSLVLLIAALSFPMDYQGTLSAQDPSDPSAESAPIPDSSTPPPTEAQLPARLPHEKFLLDYLLVALLFAAALYAVGRSSRRF